MIEKAVVEKVISAGLATGGDWAEVFAEDRNSSAAGLDDGRVEQLSSGRERGAGIRVVVGDTTGFAHTADLSEEGLVKAAQAAAAAARSGGGGVKQAPLEEVRAPRPYEVTTLPETVSKATKVELLRRADETARGIDGSIRQVSAGYSDNRRRILVANSEGVWATDDQVRTLFRVAVVATGDTGLQTGRESVGETVGFELFDKHKVEDIATRAARQALAKLNARPAPSGRVPVVMKSGSGGILFHEACGHGLEADLINKDMSVFAHRVGQKVAAPMITLVDDGTMSREWGALAIDDEGRPAARNVLISDGELTDYMWDWRQARKEGRRSSGNGRRESYRDLPMVRMTNTYLSAGTEDPEEIIRQTPYGVYVVQLGGGQVNTATGDFTFGTTEAYLIENGEITDTLRDTNLTGNGPDVLLNIDAVGTDFEMGGPGTCGKDGQGVPVGTGTPTLRVSAITVGGTAQ